MAHHIAMTSAVAVLGAGMYGCLRSGSKASLAGGALLACAFAASTAAIQKQDHIGSAFLAAAASGAACTAIGARRWARVSGRSCAATFQDFRLRFHSPAFPSPGGFNSFIRFRGVCTVFEVCVQASNKVAPALLLTIGITNMAYYSMKAWEFREHL